MPRFVTRGNADTLDCAVERANLLRGHIGSSGFAYNALVELMKDSEDENRQRKDAGEVVTKDGYPATSRFTAPRR